MFILAHRDTITYEEIQHEKIPIRFTGFNIYFIADIHRRTINTKTLQKVNKPIHLVLIGGDLVERGVPLESMRRNISKLKRWGAPVYFVWGNNDYEINTDQMKEILREENVLILEDSVVPIYKGNDKINLIGFQYYNDNHVQPSINWEEVDDNFTILLTHKPSSFHNLEETSREKIDLTLAGHTHGGQIRIVGFGFYEKGGKLFNDHSILFITEGYGYTLLPLRLQTKSQSHVISLRSTQSSFSSYNK